MSKTSQKSGKPDRKIFLIKLIEYVPQAKNRTHKKLFGRIFFPLLFQHFTKNLGSIYNATEAQKYLLRKFNFFHITCRFNRKIRCIKTKRCFLSLKVFHPDLFELSLQFSSHIYFFRSFT